MTSSNGRKGSTSQPVSRPVGRPSAGARAGEKVTDYPQLSVRVPPDVKARVEALSQVRQSSQWHIITDAIECYLRDLTVGERRKVEAVEREMKRKT